MLAITSHFDHNRDSSVSVISNQDSQPLNMDHHSWLMIDHQPLNRQPLTNGGQSSTFINHS